MWYNSNGDIMRISISKSKNAENIYIIKSVTINGKRTSKTIASLGNIETLMQKHNLNRDSVLAWARKQAETLTKQELKESETFLIPFSSRKQLVMDKRHTYQGGYIFLKKILKELSLNQICDDISSNHHFKFDLTAVLSTLIFTRILNPSSKKASFEIAGEYLEPPSFDIQHVYRALDVLAKEKDKIEAMMYHNSNKVIKRHTGVLYFDCTNFFFEIDEADGLKQYGKSKENRPNPIVQMGLFLDGNGIPLSFCINPGNTNEQTVLRPHESRMLKDFEMSRCVVCTDAGVASKDNRLFNMVGGRSYIVTQSLKQIKKYLKEWALDDNGWFYHSKDGIIGGIKLSELDEKNKKVFNRIYYKERWYIEDGLEQRLIVSYAPKYRAYQEKIRNGQIERADKMIKNGTQRKGKNQNDPARFIIETKTTSTGEVAEEVYQTLDGNKINEEARYDGFYAVCTTLQDDVAEIIKINRRRWEIEESFRIMKSEFKARPVHHRRDDRITAHFMTCFLSLLVYRLLEQKLDEKYTVHEIISTLQKMNFLHCEGQGYIPTYTRTHLTDDLHDILGARTDTEILTEKNMKKILDSLKL